jgi:hypothetical protein
LETLDEGSYIIQVNKVDEWPISFEASIVLRIIGLKINKNEGSFNLITDIVEINILEKIVDNSFNLPLEEEKLFNSISNDENEIKRNDNLFDIVPSKNNDNIYVDVQSFSQDSSSIEDYF